MKKKSTPKKSSKKGLTYHGKIMYFFLFIFGLILSFTALQIGLIMFLY